MCQRGVPSLRCIESIPGSEVHCARDDPQALDLRMPVRSDAVAIGQPQANRKEAILGWIALQDSHLRARRQRVGAGLPRDLAWDVQRPGTDSGPLLLGRETG